MLAIRSKAFLAILIIAFFPFSVRSQGLQDVLANYKGDNGQKFVQPLSDVLASTFHSQVFTGAGAAEKITVDVKLIVPFAFVTDNLRTFEGTTPAGFEPATTTEAPTVLGSSTPKTVNGINGTSYTFPGGLGSQVLWYAIPQVNVGGILGTEVSIRFFAFEPAEDVGQIRMFGLGVQHKLSRYFKDSPVDFSIGYAFNQVDFENYLKVRNHLFVAHIGKSTKIANYYALVGYKTNLTKLQLEYQGEMIDYKIGNANPLLLGLGAGIRIAFVQFNVEVNGPRPLVASAGVGIHF
ncbi:MAG: DUF6588 family protein [Saprospiraceae bacterium]